jgi:hypothetical protein
MAVLELLQLPDRLQGHAPPGRRLQEHPVLRGQCRPQLRVRLSRSVPAPVDIQNNLSVHGFTQVTVHVPQRVCALWAGGTSTWRTQTTTRLTLHSCYSRAIGQRGGSNTSRLQTPFAIGESISTVFRGGGGGESNRPLLEPEIHRVDPEFGSTLTVSNRDS